MTLWEGAAGMQQNRGEGTGPFPDSPVPEAMGRLLTLVGARIGFRAIDRIWIFPPLVRGRKEWGLIAVSRLTEDPGQRSVVTGRYAAELTGRGMVFEPEFMAEGMAPPDRLPVVMDGVVRRSDLQLGVPREEDIHGDEERFRDLLRDFGVEEEDAGPKRDE